MRNYIYIDMIGLYHTTEAENPTQAFVNIMTENTPLENLHPTFEYAKKHLLKQGVKEVFILKQ